MCPGVVIPKGARTADYIWNGEKWDLKTINSHSKNTLVGVVKNAKGQAENVSLDLKVGTYTHEILSKELERIYNNSRYKFLDKLMIIEENNLRGIYKRK